MDTPGVTEAYSVPMDGGDLIKLNGPLVPGGNVVWAIFTGDSQHAVYLADQDTDEVLELYSVAIAGGPVTKLNQPLVAGGNVTNYATSPDGSTVVVDRSAGWMPSRNQASR